MGSLSRIENCVAHVSNANYLTKLDGRYHRLLGLEICDDIDGIVVYSSS